MKITENKIICIVLMMVLIAAGFLLGGMKGLNGLYKDAETVFFTGEDKDGICVANDLSERVSAAANMITVARKYESSMSDSCRAALTALNDATGTMEILLGKPADLADIIAGNKPLDTAMADLFREMGNLELSQQDEKYRQSLYADFNSRNDTISHDPYNLYAQEYQQAADKFPASLIAAVMPVKKATVAY